MLTVDCGILELFGKENLLVNDVRYSLISYKQLQIVKSLIDEFIPRLNLRYNRSDYVSICNFPIKSVELNKYIRNVKWNVMFCYFIQV